MLFRSQRTDERDPETGGVARIHLDATDSDGRGLRADADAVSRMALGEGGASVVINTMLRWTVDGARTGWGEDQEVWSPNARREHRHATR